MIEGRVVRGVDLNADTFIKTFKRIKSAPLCEEIKATLQSLLLLNLDEAPAKLHLHQYKNKKVTSRLAPSTKVAVWSIHVTPNDCYKASFTFEGGSLHFRLVDEHDVIDKNP